MSLTTDNSKHRRGFTLLELLIVVSIIAILTSLSLLVMQGLAEQAERDATKVTIRKVNGLLTDRIDAFNRAFRSAREDRAIARTQFRLESQIQAALGGRPFSLQDQPAIKVLAKKEEFRFEFPQRFADRVGARDPVPTDAARPNLNVPGMPASVYAAIAYPGARTQLIQENSAVPNPAVDDVDQRAADRWANHTTDTESAELLYFILTRSGNFGASATDADQFTDREIADTDNDGLPEFVDAWGKPLRFYRWPTRLIDPDAPDPFEPIFANQSDPTDTRIVDPSERARAGLLIKGLPPDTVPLPNSLQRDPMLVDPDDPLGLLYSLLEHPVLLNMGVTLRDDINESAFHTIDTWHTPLIVSAGPDEELGLYEPSQWNPGAHIYGNLAQIAGTTTLAPIPTDDVVDQLTDNIVNRNSRVGARR